MEEAGEEAEAPAKGVEAIGALQGELLSGSVDEGAGVDNFDPKIDIPSMVDLREKEAVISLVLKLIPDVPVWHLESMLAGMIREFDGGKGTAWVPLGNAMSKVLQDVQKNDASAGVENLQIFVAGVREASEKQVSSVKKVSIERAVQVELESKRAGNEIKKLTGSLEVKEKLALGLNAEFLKMQRSHDKLLDDSEKDRARYVSVSSTAATNSQNVGKLQKKVESQELQIAKYKSCQVVVGDGVVQLGASQAEVTSLAEKVERMGSAMLTKSDLEKVTQDICVEVAERQKCVEEDMLARFTQANAVNADRVDAKNDARDAVLAEQMNSVVEALSNLGAGVPQLGGRQGQEGEETETATDGLKFTPGRLRLKFPSAEERAQKVTSSVHYLLQFAAAQCARQDFCDAHWAFAIWKDQALESARQDKKMFARGKRLKVPNKIHKLYVKCYRNSADVSLSGLKARVRRWDDLCDHLVVANADGQPGIWQNPKKIVFTDNGEAQLLDVEDATPLKAVPVATPHRSAVKEIDVMTVMKTVLNSNALQQDQYRRQSSNVHPRMEQQEGPSSPDPSSQSDGDAGEEDTDGSTGAESDDSVIHPVGVKGFFDSEAEASDGGGRSSASEGSAVYDEVISKNAVGEKEILLSPYNPLHDIASAEIKKKSEWASKVLVALLQLQEAYSRSKGSLRKNALAGVARLWSKFPEAPTLSDKQMLVIKAYDKVAGMRGKNESRRVSMEDYDAESAEYYGPSNSEGPRENIYLKNEAKKSVTQCFNIVRSKLTIESRMYKKGTTSKWHTTMKPFIDGTVVAEELIAFAEAVCGLESGSADELEEEMGWFPDELLDPHNGLKRGDWSRRVWTHLRGLKLSKKSGRPKVKETPKSREAKGEAARAKGGRGLADGDRGDPHASSAEPSEDESSEDQCRRMHDGKAKRPTSTKRSGKSRPQSKAELRRRKKAEEKRKHDEEHEDELTEREAKMQLVMAKKLQEEEVREAEMTRLRQKVVGSNKQPLPILNASREVAHQSGQEYRGVVGGNQWQPHQTITHLHGQAKDKTLFAKEGQSLSAVVIPAEYKKPSKMLEYVQKGLKRELLQQGVDERPYELNSDEAAKETMARFWLKWAEDLGEGIAESRLESKQEKWESDWRGLRFWYGQSPEDMLMMLQEMQAEAWEIELPCSDDKVKKLFGALVLPTIGGFRNNRPEFIQTIFTTPGKKLTGLRAEQMVRRGVWSGLQQAAQQQGESQHLVE